MTLPSMHPLERTLCRNGTTVSTKCFRGFTGMAGREYEVAVIASLHCETEVVGHCATLDEALRLHADTVRHHGGVAGWFARLLAGG